MDMEPRMCTKCKAISTNYYKSRPSRCKPCQNQRHKEWLSENRDKWNTYHLKYTKMGRQFYNRKKVNPVLKKFYENRRVAISRGIRFNKTNKIIKGLGCSAEYARSYIEKLWQPGMTWENYGMGIDMWNLDHIVPLSSAKTKKEVKKLLHYNNLQPLWSLENNQKGHNLYK